MFCRVTLRYYVFFYNCPLKLSPEKLNVTTTTVYFYFKVISLTYSTFMAYLHQQKSKRESDVALYGSYYRVSSLLLFPTF